jgi:hypothetical protein
MERMGGIKNAWEVMAGKLERETATWTHTLIPWSVTTEHTKHYTLYVPCMHFAFRLQIVGKSDV